MTPSTEGAPRRPDFVVIGAMKAGTTSLYHYLREHPEIFMPRVKELDFFVAESNWHRGASWYEEQFAANGGARCVGEASTLYAKYPHFDGVPARMASVIPDAKLIYVVRDPLERIRSHYEHRVATGAERDPMERALLENHIYVDYTRYACQIDRYLEHFRPEQLLVMTAEALRHDRRRTMETVYGFLGVDPLYVPSTLDQEFYRTGSRRTYPPLVWSARRLLKRHVPQSKRAKEVVDSLLRRHRPPEVDPSHKENRMLPSHVEGAIVEMLRDDMIRLRRFLGDEFDCWGLEPADGSPAVGR